MSVEPSHQIRQIIGASMVGETAQLPARPAIAPALISETAAQNSSSWAEF